MKRLRILFRLMPDHFIQGREGSALTEGVKRNNFNTSLVWKSRFWMATNISKNANICRFVIGYGMLVWHNASMSYYTMLPHIPSVHFYLGMDWGQVNDENYTESSTVPAYSQCSTWVLIVGKHSIITFSKLWNVHMMNSKPACTVAMNPTGLVPMTCRV